MGTWDARYFFHETLSFLTDLQSGTFYNRIAESGLGAGAHVVDADGIDRTPFWQGLHLGDRFTMAWDTVWLIYELQVTVPPQANLPLWIIGAVPIAGNAPVPGVPPPGQLVIINPKEGPMSNTTRWQNPKELAQVHAALGTKVSGTDPGHWLDFAGMENLRISISGTITAGSYDVLACDLPTRPDDADNAHPSLLQGLDGTKLNWMQFQAPPHWVKFITTDVVGVLHCGATADEKDAWKR